MPYPTTRKTHRLRPANLADVSAAFAAQVAARSPRQHADELTQEARAALALWIVSGPVRADGSPRFANWNPDAAGLALQRRAKVETLARRRRFVRNVKRGHGWRSLAVPASRLVLRAPRSLWCAAFAACERAARRLDHAPAKVTFDPAPFSPPAKIAAHPSAWDKLAQAFAEHVADARAMLTATWGNARHRATLAEVALVAVGDWLAVRARRTAADLPLVLLRRTARAEAAQVCRFALWPASLLRAVRRALNLVSVAPVAVRLTVRIAA